MTFSHIILNIYSCRQSYNENTCDPYVLVVELTITYFDKIPLLYSLSDPYMMRLFLFISFIGIA